MKALGLLAPVLNFAAERYLKAAGQQFVFEGDYDAALQTVDKVLQIESDNLRAQLLKADVLFCLNRDVESLHLLTQILKRQPQCVEAHLARAGVLDVLGHTRDALASCLHALELAGPQHEALLPSLYDQKLLLLVRLKQFRAADRSLAEATQRLPEEDSQRLLADYRDIVTLGCRARATVRERRRRLSLEVLPGGLSA